MAYDKIANKDYTPISKSPEDYKKQEKENPIITVRVDKGDNEPLVRIISLLKVVYNLL